MERIDGFKYYKGIAWGAQVMEEGEIVFPLYFFIRIVNTTVLGDMGKEWGMKMKLSDECPS